jgi:hypothetical protein
MSSASASNNSKACLLAGPGGNCSSTLGRWKERLEVASDDELDKLDGFGFCSRCRLQDYWELIHRRGTFNGNLDQKRMVVKAAMRKSELVKSGKFLCVFSDPTYIRERADGRRSEHAMNMESRILNCKKKSCEYVSEPDKLCSRCHQLAKTFPDYSKHFYSNGKVKFKCFFQDDDFKDYEPRKLIRSDFDQMLFGSVPIPSGTQEKVDKREMRPLNCNSAQRKGELCENCLKILRKEFKVHKTKDIPGLENGEHDGRVRGRNMLHTFN